MAESERGSAKVDAAAIYTALRADVLRGELTAGEPVREVAVASRFGVSRTPVREALRRLEHDRLLVPSSRGLVVRGVDIDEVIQTYTVRILLESEAAAEAAGARSQADLLRLESLADRDRSLQDPDDATRAETNMEFHEAIWTATHNPVLQDLLRRLTVHLVRIPHSTLSAPGRWEQALDEHAAIATAIRERDREAAREHAASHMTHAREIRLQLLRDNAASLLHRSTDTASLTGHAHPRRVPLSPPRPVATAGRALGRVAARAPARGRRLARVAGLRAVRVLVVPGRLVHRRGRVGRRAARRGRPLPRLVRGSARPREARG